MEAGENTMKWDASALKKLDDSEIQKKIDYEVRMREGTVKLLAACHEEEQTLEASKNMHTINARILALMSLLQRHRAKSVISRRKESCSTEQIESTKEPCKAKVSLSDIRIPLMWSPDDHVKAKTEQHVYFVFCLLKMDGQVLDTTMVATDESETDITFPDVIVFENVHSDFKLEIEIYYTLSSESAANRNLGIRKPLRRTLSGQEGMKFVLAGHTQLTVEHLDDKIKTYDLKTGLVGASPSASTVSTEETHTPDLALWGQICVRLAAQPDCIGTERAKGYLNIQCLNNGQNSWSRKWCVLYHSSIACWEKEEDCEIEAKPTDTIDIKVNTQLKDTVSPSLKQQHILILASSTHEKEPVLSTATEEEFATWKIALEQAMRDVTAWKRGCRTEMKIQCPSTRKLPPAHKKLYDSINVELTSVAEGEPEIPLPPKPELADLNTDSQSVKCTYDVWQRRKPERSSLREKKERSNSDANYESNI